MAAFGLLKQYSSSATAKKLEADAQAGQMLLPDQAMEAFRKRLLNGEEEK